MPVAPGATSLMEPADQFYGHRNACRGADEIARRRWVADSNIRAEDLMPMTPRMRRLYAAFCLTPFLIAALPIYRELTRRRDIWWTPITLAVPLADSKDRVEVYVRREPLAALLQSGQLRLQDNGRSSVLAPSDIGFRFNNWDRVRGEHLGLLLVSAAVCGVTAVLGLLILTGRLTYREEVARS